MLKKRKNKFPVFPQDVDKTFSWSGVSVSIGRCTYGITAASIISWGSGTLSIGRYCSVANGVSFFLGGEHRTDVITTYPFGHTSSHGGRLIKFDGHPKSKGPISISHDVWIGNSAKVLSGVSIGTGAVIGAGSVVTKSVGPYEIWAGNPARQFKTRFTSDVIDALLLISWWDWPFNLIEAHQNILTLPPDEKVIEKLMRISENNPR